jgi:hypothetical protein
LPCPEKKCPTLIDKITLHYTDAQKYKYLYIDKFYQLFKILGKIIDTVLAELVEKLGRREQEFLALFRSWCALLCRDG